MKPLLSIIVPTKDRYKYLIHLINLISKFQNHNLELVLQDNTFDNSEILAFLAEKEFPFIKYAHDSKPIPIVLNADLAVLNSSGKYVCMIGDDDGVTSHILECVKWMDDNEIEALMPSTISYHWPDYINSLASKISGTLMFKPFSKTCMSKDPNVALNEIMQKGFINRGELPLLYHGIVRRDVLDKIFEIGETYFPGPSPDIANGVALSLLVKKYVQLDFPITISGASKTHGGGIRKLKNKVAAIEDVPFLPPNAKENWEKNIPKVWTGETVWPESAIKALRYMKREDLISKVNFEYMLGKFVAFHLPIGKMAISLSKNKAKLVCYFIYFFFLRYRKGFIRIVARRFFNTDGKKIAIKNMENIEQVAAYLISIEPIFTRKSIQIKMLDKNEA